MNENELRAKYRTTRLELCLEADAAKASEMAKRLSHLTDEQFEQYASQSAKALTDLKAKAGLTGQGSARSGGNTDTDGLQKARAAQIDDYLSDVFGIDEYFAQAEEEDRTKGR